MLKKTVISIIILITSIFSLWANREEITLLPIDTMYSSWVTEFSPLAEKWASQVWQGMKLSPVCAFRINGPAFLYNHPNPPSSFEKVSDNLWRGRHKDLRLYGATTVEIKGIQTAIMPYGDRPRDKHDFMGEFFHEMHHTFQWQEKKLSHFPDISHLITYPENAENAVLMQRENRLLLDPALNPSNEDFQKQINQFYSIRLRRSEIIGEEYMMYEKREESMEGPAVFCEYRFRELADILDDSEEVNRVRDDGRFFLPLTEMRCSRDEIRELKLMAGLCQCLILEKKLQGWQERYYKSGLPLSDFFFQQFPPEEVETAVDSEDLKMANYFTEIEKEKRLQKLDEFENHEGIRVDIRFLKIPQPRGLDPMNMTAVDQKTILHSTQLKLGRGDNYLSFMDGKVCSKIKQNVWSHHRLFFFIRDREDLWTTVKRRVALRTRSACSFTSSVPKKNLFFLSLIFP